MEPLLDDCPICLDPLQENIEQLICEHSFHSQCIETWRTTGGDSCPVCRTTLQNVHETIDRFILIKFHSNKAFVQCATAVDIGFSIIACLSGQLVATLYVMASMLGYYGAKHLSIQYLTAYTHFYFLIIIITSINLTIQLEEQSINSIRIVGYSLTNAFRLYVLFTIYKMCNVIRMYRDQLRQSFT
ncbi:MAG: hypothetical protein CMM25_04770 [Rhodospirillaceae bacterium]|nr:hypothetical protein [Rhodospirillaceae bacterium]